MRRDQSAAPLNQPSRRAVQTLKLAQTPTVISQNIQTFKSSEPPRKWLDKSHPRGHEIERSELQKCQKRNFINENTGCFVEIFIATDGGEKVAASLEG